MEAKSKPSNYLECCFVWILIAFNDDSWSSLIRSNERHICFDSVHLQKFKYPATTINWHTRAPKFIRQNLKKIVQLCVCVRVFGVYHSLNLMLSFSNQCQWHCSHKNSSLGNDETKIVFASTRTAPIQCTRSLIVI